jgi:hypothetical protein
MIIWVRRWAALLLLAALVVADGDKFNIKDEVCCGGVLASASSPRTLSARFHVQPAAALTLVVAVARTLELLPRWLQAPARDKSAAENCFDVFKLLRVTACCALLSCRMFQAEKWFQKLSKSWMGKRFMEKADCKNFFKHMEEQHAAFTAESANKLNIMSVCASQKQASARACHCGAAWPPCSVRVHVWAGAAAPRARGSMCFCPASVGVHCTIMPPCTPLLASKSRSHPAWYYSK